MAVEPERSLAIAARPDHGIGVISAGFPRSPGLRVLHTPIDEPPEHHNPAHASIRSNDDNDALDRCNLMAAEMTREVLIYPVGSPWRPDSAPSEDA